MTDLREQVMRLAKGFVEQWWDDKSNLSDIAGMYKMSVLQFRDGWQASFKFYEERRWHRSKDRYPTPYHAKLYATFAAIKHARKHTNYDLDEIVGRAFLGGGS